MRYRIEYKLTVWNVAAMFEADDLALIALKAFRRAQPHVEWRMVDAESDHD